MKTGELIRRLNEAVPENIALSWDNSGFLIGHEDREADRILVCVDVTDGAVEVGGDSFIVSWDDIPMFFMK